MSHGGVPTPQGEEHPRAAPAATDGQKFVRGLLFMGLILGIVFLARSCANGKQADAPASAEKPAERPSAPPEGPAVAKSGFVPDMRRGVSNALSHPFDWTEKLLPSGKGESSEPPEGVVKIWLRPGEAFWEGKISVDHPSPWLMATEDVYLFVDTGDKGSQDWEFYPGNPKIRRVKELSSKRPLLTRIYGEQPVK